MLPGKKVISQTAFYSTMWKFGVFTMNQYWFLRAPLPVGQIVTGRELLWAKIEVSIPPPFFQHLGFVPSGTLVGIVAGAARFDYRR